MDLARIKFSNLLFDRELVPSIRVIRDETLADHYRIEMTIGVVATPLTSSDDKTTCREMEIGKDIYSTPISAAIGLVKPTTSDDDPSSTIKVVFSATLNTKLPRTGGFRIVDLDQYDF